MSAPARAVSRRHRRRDAAAIDAAMPANALGSMSQAYRHRRTISAQHIYHYATHNFSSYRRQKTPMMRRCMRT